MYANSQPTRAFVVGRHYQRPINQVLEEDVAPFTAFQWDDSLSFELDAESRTVTVSGSGFRPRRARYHDDQGCTILPTDGEQIFCFGNGRIYRHHVADAATETIVDIAGSHAGFPTLSPDAGALAFSALELPMDPENRPPRLFLLNFAGGKTEQVAPHRHSADRFPQWSPTSRSLAFGRGFYGPAGISTGVVLADRTDLGTRLLPAEAGWNQSIGRFCWSYDGAHVLVVESLGDNMRRLAAFRTDSGDRVWSLKEPGILGGWLRPVSPKSPLCHGQVSKSVRISIQAVGWLVTAGGASTSCSCRSDCGV